MMSKLSASPRPLSSSFLSFTRRPRWRLLGASAPATWYVLSPTSSRAGNANLHSMGTRCVAPYALACGAAVQAGNHQPRACKEHHGWSGEGKPPHLLRLPVVRPCRVSHFQAKHVMRHQILTLH